MDCDPDLWLWPVTLTLPTMSITACYIDVMDNVGCFSLHRRYG